jgi:hypothetical protein
MRNLIVLTLVLLSACRSQSPSLEQLVKTCQEKTQVNFTYGPDTATVLREHGYRLEGEPATPEAWMQALRGALATQGLELEPIGPEHIRVMLVRAHKPG